MITRRVYKITKLRLALATVLVLSLLAHGYGAEWQDPPPGQPDQMCSKVNYDPKLTDRFFESDQWSCWHGGIGGATCRDGKPVLILTPPCKQTWRSVLYEEECPFEVPEWTCLDGCKECAICERGRPLLKHTARCYSTSFGVKHEVRFCEARLLDVNVIDLSIHENDPAFRDSLRVRIRNGEFTCRYWVPDDVGAFKWTTKRQMLTLDKQVYQKGDVIKGRIEFECFAEPINPKYVEKWSRNPRTTKVYGVFKTIVE